MTALLTWWKNHKLHLTALGLFGLALYHLSTGDYAAAGRSLLEALAALGVYQHLTE